MSTMLAKTCKAGVTGLRPRPRALRCPTLIRAATDNGDGPSTSGSTVFYGGAAFSEAEFKQALSSGKLARSSAPAAPAEAATTALSFQDVMGFSGTAPEIVNGRLAMLGFTSAVAAELVSGESVLRQWSEEPTGVAIAFLLFIAGSLVTAFQGKRDQKLGPFTPAAELLNGRLAMIGFAAMLAIEAVRGTPLI